ncbi:MAG: hypothetical protein M3288_03215 [Thermoproteota archaeon]|nr:hypothetical protein [Thermoproteota archaeon]
MSQIYQNTRDRQPSSRTKEEMGTLRVDGATPHECAKKKTEPTSASRTPGHYWFPRGIKMGSENTGSLCDAQRRTLSYGSYGIVQNPRIGDIV